MHLDPRGPGHLRDGIGQLLEPRPVRATTVVEDRRGISNERQLTVRRLPHSGVAASSGGSRKSCPSLRGVAPHATVLQRLGPEGVEGAAVTNLTLHRAPRPLQVILVRCIRKPSAQAAAHLSRDLEQYVAGLTGIEHRLHDRLLQRVDTGARFEVIPLF